jgi:hypothetical protein
MNGLSHEQIVDYFKTSEAKEIIGKEITEFFQANEQLFADIYENKVEEPEENNEEVNDLT